MDIPKKCPICRSWYEGDKCPTCEFEEEELE